MRLFGRLGSHGSVAKIADTSQRPTYRVFWDQMLEISTQQARRIAVASQGLHSTKSFGTGKAAVQRCIEHLGYVQIDTISVINRSHHHTFWTRVPSYREEHLEALQREGAIFEYWAHAAAYLPLRDYRFCLPYMHAVASGQKHWRTPNKRQMRRVLERIRAEGPLRATDFEDPKPQGQSWGWNWKPAKIALEQLFIEGKLLVCRREGFQKVYDLPERALPPGIDTRMPTDAEFQRYLIRSALRAHGLVAEAEVSYLRKGTRPGVKARLQEMVEEGELVEVTIAGQKQPYYAAAELLEVSAKRVGRHVHLLSPFDNLVIQRRRIHQLFDTDYQLECFVPADKRRFGYFCLPIVYGSDIVGRLDPKADRRSGELTINALFLEKPIQDQSTFVEKLANKLRQLATFNQCERIVYKSRQKDALGRRLLAHLTTRSKAQG